MRAILLTLAVVLSLGWSGAAAAQITTPPFAGGTVIDLGGRRLHFDCLGAGSPTVVIKNAFDESSFDWIAVQAELAKTHGVCAYDRAGYAWSDPCPKPGTFAQINLEMHDVLRQLNERPPCILVGDAFGAATVRN
jgi:pimeloyl-ACP methyl ester carboxylesterase